MIIDLFEKYENRTKYRLTIGLLVWLAMLVSLLAIVVFGTYVYRITNVDKFAARVGEYEISWEEVDYEVSKLAKFLTVKQEDINYDVITRDSIDKLIDRYFVESYAEENDISIPAEQVDEYYNLRLANYDTETSFLNELNEFYGIDKESYLEGVEYDLLREAVQARLNTPLTEWLAEQREISDIQFNLSK